MPRAHKQAEFLSIQAQDFIEDSCRIDEWGILSDS